ncbi:4-hydroxy-tetrahydrodipicolinate reductase [subsurface metagenome]
MGLVRIVVSGALGAMGREVIRAVLREPDMKLAGALEEKVTLKYLTLPETSEQVPFSSDPDSLLKSCNANVLVDFTKASASIAIARIALKNKVNMVIGSTGLTEDNLEEIDQLCRDNGVSAIESPNFSLGTLLMMHLARIVATYYDYAEIIERHPDNKPDAPSATSIAMAKGMLKARGKPFIYPETKTAIISNTRGGQIKGIPIHSVRSPGVPSSGHEIMFSRPGQNLTLCDETISRESYMPGVILAIREVLKHKGLIRDWEPWKF